MNFDDWVVLIDAAQHHARGLLQKIDKLDGRDPSPGELASIEGLCRRFLDTIPPPIVHTRPRDVMPYEWDGDPYAILLARLRSLQAVTTERSANISLWIHELHVALVDFLEGWDWFDSRIER